jgi:hypothetical protein
MISEGEVVLGLQPAAILACQPIEWSAFDHRSSPGTVPLSARKYGPRHEFDIETIETYRF